MKKSIETTKKARSLAGWHKHLRRGGKQVANRGTRRIAKQSDRIE